MTECCPKCGGKWDGEGHRDFNPESKHWISIPEGGRVEVLCYCCNTVIVYHLSRDQEIEFALEREAELYKLINKLDERVKELGGSIDDII